jgi:hypothetical protein
MTATHPVEPGKAPGRASSQPIKENDMANKTSKASLDQLRADVRVILRLAARKKGVTGLQILEALKIKEGPTGYHYRRAIKAAREKGLERIGFGKHSVWRLLRNGKAGKH